MKFNYNVGDVVLFDEWVYDEWRDYRVLKTRVGVIIERDVEWYWDDDEDDEFEYNCYKILRFGTKEKRWVDEDDVLYAIMEKGTKLSRPQSVQHDGELGGMMTDGTSTIIF